MCLDHSVLRDGGSKLSWSARTLHFLSLQRRPQVSTGQGDSVVVVFGGGGLLSLQRRLQVSTGQGDSVDVVVGGGGLFSLQWRLQVSTVQGDSDGCC